jgi:penicillin V acylase-like amidase (Ntn superfamily)
MEWGIIMSKFSRILLPLLIILGSLQAVRLVLDYAKNVDEAVELLGKYNINFDLAEQSHYLISDATGKSVIVEFVEDEMIVLEKENPWQVNANFMVSDYSDAQDAAYRHLCLRYQNAFKILKNKNGTLKNGEPFDILATVAQSSTLYSTVYNTTSGDIQVAIHRKFDEIYQFKMPMRSDVSQ